MLNQCVAAIWQASIASISFAGRMPSTIAKKALSRVSSVVSSEMRAALMRWFSSTLAKAKPRLPNASCRRFRNPSLSSCDGPSSRGFPAVCDAILTETRGARAAMRCRAVAMLACSSGVGGFDASAGG